MKPLAPDEKIALVMLYTHNMLVRGEIVIKESLRVSIWLYFFGPAIVALLIMIGLSVFLLDYLIASLVEQPPMSWIASCGAFWLAKL